MAIKVGTSIGMLNPKYFVDVAVAADELGYESLWMPEHLVFPLSMAGSPHAAEEGDAAHPPVPPETPLYDVFAYLAFLAGRTRRIRLGTNVYLLGLRHPFIAARAVQTLDLVSGGRAEVGVGAGWLRRVVGGGPDGATGARRHHQTAASTANATPTRYTVRSSRNRGVGGGRFPGPWGWRDMRSTGAAGSARSRS